MRIQLLSDLHLENYPGFMPRAAADVDVLILAGDIGSYQARSRLDSDDFGLGRFSPRQPQSGWPRVFYLPGNHEFDGLDYDATYQRLRSTCDDLGIEWLERETITVGAVRFVGTTLWSDFEALAKSKAGMTEQTKALEKLFGRPTFTSARTRPRGMVKRCWQKTCACWRSSASAGCSMH